MNLLLLLSKDDGVLRGRRAQHLIDKWKVSPGQRVEIGVARQGMGSARVASVGPDEVVLDELDLTILPAPRLHLVCALPRPKALRRILQVAASLGIGHIDLINAWRVEKSYWSSPVLKEEALQAELVLGCEQGRNPWLPTISLHRYFSNFVDGLSEDSREKRILLDPRGPAMLDKEGTEEVPLLRFAVGPERGWSDDERVRLAQEGFHPTRISSYVLKTEVAIAVFAGQASLSQRS